MNLKYNKEIQYSILKKYFEDKASDEEKNLVNEWLDDPEDVLRFKSCLRLLWKEMDLDSPESSIDLNALLDKVHHIINLTGEKEKIKSLPKNTKPVISFNLVIRNIARIAAIMLLPLMAYIGWEICTQKIWRKNQAEIVYNEIICPLGARSQFELPDGTKGSLNNGSSLKYPVKFFGGTREVELVGEAFFDVYHDKNKPFIIKTTGLDVKVLGTRLNVYSYADENYQEITLESGEIELIKREGDREISITSMKPGQHVIYRYEEDKVNVEMDKLVKESKTIDMVKSKEDLEEYSLKMKPGQNAIYEIQGGNIEIKFDETNHYTSWKDGKLILRNDPMIILLKRIERWYNVKFNILDESINEYTYWATFEEENLDQVLKLLSLTGPIKFEKHPREQLVDGTFSEQEIDVMLKN